MRRPVSPRRRFAPARLVRARLVVVLTERLEATRLLVQVGACWLHRLLERQVKALEHAVLLRLAGIDPLVMNAQLRPPRRQRRKPAHARRSEGRAVVRADDLGQAILVKSPFKTRSRLTLARARGRREPDEITAMHVGDRQRLAANAIAEPNPTLVVRGPHVIGPRGLGQGARTRRRAAMLAARRHEPGAFQNLAAGGIRGPGYIRPRDTKPVEDHARAHAWLVELEGDDRVHDLRSRRMGRAVRRMRAFGKTRKAAGGMTITPLEIGRASCRERV